MTNASARPLTAVSSTISSPGSRSCGLHRSVFSPAPPSPPPHPGIFLRLVRSTLPPTGALLLSKLLHIPEPAGRSRAALSCLAAPCVELPRTPRLGCASLPRSHRYLRPLIVGDVIHLSGQSNAACAAPQDRWPPQRSRYNRRKPLPVHHSSLLCTGPATISCIRRRGSLSDCIQPATSRFSAVFR